MKKRITNLLPAMLLVGQANAAMITVDDVKYDLNTSAKTAKVVGCTAGKNSVSIKAEVTKESEKYKVTAIGAKAFRDNHDLQYVGIQENLASIGDSAFYNVGLTTLAVPKGITKLGKYAFAKCMSLQTASFSDGINLTEISDGAFADCSSLTKITVPESVKTIGENAFKHCAKLGTVTLPEGLKTIGGAAFMNCGSLESIVIPTKVDSIGFSAFGQCNNLKSIVAKPMTSPRLGRAQ